STTIQANFGNASTRDLFPPVCLTYHWDPTAVLRRVVPLGPNVPLALDPRPWTKVCLEYVNSGQSSEQAPAPPANMVFPSGGEFYPPGRYSAAIDNESLLRRLDRTLGTCDAQQYEPNQRGDMYVPNRLVPEREYQPSTDMVKELAMPRALLRGGPYDCRLEADKANWSRSTSLFFNATKQQRYNQGFKTKQLQPNQAAKMQ
ncbi:MAG: hypothetical protein EBU82_06800, partial [Flavobacteriia bacterium]|nr:hypothetical protein [Flavobacteriia bacterium]